MSGIRHITTIKEPFDCIRGKCGTPGCPSFPRGDGRNHGIGTEVIEMAAIGKHTSGLVAVNFTYATGRTLGVTPLSPSLRNYYPSAHDLGQHASVASYEGQYQSPYCSHIGGTCFYDGSSLAADRYLEALERSGKQAVWDMLDDYLREFMEELDAGSLS